METRLRFKYDRKADILYIDRVRPYPEQETEELGDDVIARLDLACQAYQFALDVVRLTEHQNHPDLSPEELAWRVTRRMQGDPSLGEK